MHIGPGTKGKRAGADVSGDISRRGPPRVHLPVEYRAAVCPIDMGVVEAGSEAPKNDVIRGAGGDCNRARIVKANVALIAVLFHDQGFPTAVIGNRPAVREVIVIAIRAHVNFKVAPGVILLIEKAGIIYGHRTAYPAIDGSAIMVGGTGGSADGIDDAVVLEGVGISAAAGPETNANGKGIVNVGSLRAASACRRDRPSIDDIHQAASFRQNANRIIGRGCAYGPPGIVGNPFGAGVHRHPHRRAVVVQYFTVYPTGIVDVDSVVLPPESRGKPLAGTRDIALHRTVCIVVDGDRATAVLNHLAHSKVVIIPRSARVGNLINRARVRRQGGGVIDQRPGIVVCSSTVDIGVAVEVQCARSIGRLNDGK